MVLECLGSITAIMMACHVIDQGSTPCLGVNRNDSGLIAQTGRVPDF